jgi:hypothetical protein
VRTCMTWTCFLTRYVDGRLTQALLRSV